MALANYDDLQTNIADYILRPDAPIKSFIALAERDVAPSIKHYLQEKMVTLTSAANAVTLPADFQDARRITIDGVLATPVSAYDPTVQTGEIGYFQRGNTYQIVPAQLANRSVEIIYYARVPVLSDTAKTNWLISVHYPFNFGRYPFSFSTHCAIHLIRSRCGKSSARIGSLSNRSRFEKSG